METVTAVVVLGIICSGVLAVFNRCMDSVTDSKMKMQALEVARENMETLLTRETVQEKVEYGTSERYPEIEWETKVEPFYEPVTDQMWVRAVCTAEYNNSEDERKEIELVHWITSLSKQQLLEMIKQKEQSIQYTDDQLISDPAEAAAYAEVDISTLQEWMENGMQVTEDDEFIKPQLDLYKNTGGDPSQQQRQQALLDLSQQEMESRQQSEQDGLSEQPSDRQGQQSPSDSEKTDSQQPRGDDSPESDSGAGSPGQDSSDNPLGLPDGYENWSINEIIQWLKENGYF